MNQMNTVEILSKLVSFPVLGGQSNLSIAKWIENYLVAQGVNYGSLTSEDGRKRAIHCRIGPPIDGGIILSGHMDVVPVDGQPWDSDPFVLTDRGEDRWYGRGTCDMKGFLACCLALLPEMLRAPLKRPIYLAFSYDEEVGCLAGQILAEEIKNFYTENIRYAIIGEPTLLQPVTGQKGMVIYQTTVNGSAGHSSRIKQEVSAIHEASRLILWLENKMNQLISDQHLDNRFDPPHTSIHCGFFDRSGIAPNVISESATFSWDLRTIPRDHVAEIKRDFNQYCLDREIKLRTRFADFRIDTKALHPEVPPLDTADDSEAVQLAQQISGRKDTGAVSYASEAGQFAATGFDSVICGPGDIQQAHRANEFISKEQLVLGDRMLRRLIELWIK